MTESFPLHWPIGKPRTPKHQRTRSRFNQSQSAAVDKVVAEVRLLRGAHVVISTDLELRRDGLPYSNQRQPEDQGAAVYFTIRKNGKDVQMAFACDRWDRIGDNIYAIGKTIEALRGIERWGSGSMVEAAFTGFMALPAPNCGSWRDVFAKYGFPLINRIEDLEAAYRKAAQSAHPDTEGDHAAMAELNSARDEAKRELTGANP
jgi:hypothetical protein